MQVTDFTLIERSSASCSATFSGQIEAFGKTYNFRTICYAENFLGPEVVLCLLYTQTPATRQVFIADKHMPDLNALMMKTAQDAGFMDFKTPAE